jgi:hypothetical protein
MRITGDERRLLKGRRDALSACEVSLAYLTSLVRSESAFEIA